MPQRYLVSLGDGEEVGFELEANGEGVRVRREGGEWQTCELSRVGDSGLHLLILDNQPVEIYLERRRGGALVTIGRHAFQAEVAPWRPPSQRTRAGTAASGALRIVAPMTGSIVEVRCQEGDQVSKGQVVLVIESMKMNNELRSPADGVIESVGVKAGERVNANHVLATLRAGD
jgi:biotin carboxyl carrier protein